MAAAENRPVPNHGLPRALRSDADCIAFYTQIYGHPPSPRMKRSEMTAAFAICAQEAPDLFPNYEVPPSHIPSSPRVSEPPWLSEASSQEPEEPQDGAIYRDQPVTSMVTMEGDYRMCFHPDRPSVSAMCDDDPLRQITENSAENHTEEDLDLDALILPSDVASAAAAQNKAAHDEYQRAREERLLLLAQLYDPVKFDLERDAAAEMLTSALKEEITEVFGHLLVKKSHYATTQELRSQSKGSSSRSLSGVGSPMSTMSTASQNSGFCRQVSPQDSIFSGGTLATLDSTAGGLDKLGLVSRETVQRLLLNGLEAQENTSVQWRVIKILEASGILKISQSARSVLQRVLMKQPAPEVREAVIRALKLK